MSLVTRESDVGKCPKCLNIVFDNKDCICCDSCNSWIHRKCSKLNKQSFRFLVENPIQNWLYEFCLRKTLPFQSLSDNQLKNILAPIEERDNDQLVCLLSMRKQCNVCNRKVVDVSINCASFLHKRCSRLQVWQFRKVSTIVTEWCCPTRWQDRFPFSQIENQSLNELSFISNYSCRCQTTSTESSSDYRLLENLNLCKLDLKEHDNLFNNDIDTFANFHSNFDYYTSHDFHKVTNNLDTDTSLNLLHTNSQSLLANNENLGILLYNLNFNFDIFALSEMWHTKGNTHQLSALSLPGYQPYQGIAGNSKNGGCGFYSKDNIKFEIRKDLNKIVKSNNSEFDAFWIESGYSVIGVMYNHPQKTPSDFLNYVNSTLNKLSKENKEITLLGDFNLDLLKFDKLHVIEQFVNVMFCFQLVILQPTRYTDNSRPTVIDNIFVNSLDLKAISGNLISKISDHMPNFIILQRNISENKKLKII